MNIADLGNSSFHTPIDDTDYQDPVNTLSTLLRTATQGVGGAFRQELNQVKARFDENSWIDIRGCRIGQDPDYLEAIRVFFGRTDHLSSVSGPEWYQSFPRAGSIPLASEANIDTLWGNGNNQRNQHHISQHIQDTFNLVRGLAGIDSHMDFWEQVSDLSNFEFAALAWKGDLPDLPIVTPRLENFNTLNFSDTITRINEIFHLASNPPPATLTRIENIHASMLALQVEIQTIQQLAGQASELQQSFQRLRQISQLGGGLNVVPAAAPAGLNAAHLQTYSRQLKKYFELVIILNGPVNLFETFLELEGTPTDTRLQELLAILSDIEANIGANGIVATGAEAAHDKITLQQYVQPLGAHLESNADMVTFKQTLHTKVRVTRSTAAQQPEPPDNARSDFRYFFFIGLPLLVEPHDNHFYYALHAHQDEAIRSFMRAQWQEPIPNPKHVNVATMGQNRARRISVLTERGPYIDSEDYVDPYPKFNDHIKTRP